MIRSRSRRSISARSESARADPDRARPLKGPLRGPATHGLEFPQSADVGFGPERENHASARRTVIGQDRAGRILFMVAPQGYFTLHQLSAYLTESDLDLDIAINLDGGGSTGILVANPPEVISPTRLIPFVILIYPR